jgi:hypothetical protein
LRQHLLTQPGPRVRSSPVDVPAHSA